MGATGGPSVLLKSPDRIQKIRGDRNCLFRCFSHLVTGSQNHYHAIHSVIVIHYQNIPPYIAGSVTIDDYLSLTHMNKTGTWGTDKEVLDFAHLIRTSVYVYGRDDAQINVKKEAVNKSTRATINYGASEW